MLAFRRFAGFLAIATVWIGVIACTESPAGLLAGAISGLSDDAAARAAEQILRGAPLNVAVDRQTAWSWPAKGVPDRVRVPIQVVQAGVWRLALALAPAATDDPNLTVVAQKRGQATLAGRSPEWQTLDWKLSPELASCGEARWVLAAEGATILRLAARSQVVNDGEWVYQSTGTSLRHWVKWPLVIVHSQDGPARAESPISPCPRESAPQAIRLPRGL